MDNTNSPEMISDLIPHINARSIKFHNNLMHLVEEVRFRRNLDRENEHKIKELIGEKHFAEVKLEEELSKVNEMKEKYDESLKDEAQNYEKKIRILQEEKAKKKIALETVILEMKSIRDEAKSLQLSNMELTRQVRDLESQHRLQSSLRENSLEQVNRCREGQEKTMLTCNKLALTQEHVKDMVTQALAQQHKLEHFNLQQMQKVHKLEEESKTLKNQVLQLRSSVSSKEIFIPSSENNLEVIKLNTRVSKLMEETAYLRKELQDEKMESLRTVSSLAESSHLLNQSVSRTDVIQREKDDLNRDLETSNRRADRMQAQLDESEERLRTAGQEYFALQCRWKEFELLKVDKSNAGVQCEVFRSDKEVQTDTSTMKDVQDFSSPLDQEIIGPTPEKVQEELSNHILEASNFVANVTNDEEEAMDVDLHEVVLVKIVVEMPPEILAGTEVEVPNVTTEEKLPENVEELPSETIEILHENVLNISHENVVVVLSKKDLEISSGNVVKIPAVLCDSKESNNVIASNNTPIESIITEDLNENVKNQEILVTDKYVEKNLLKDTKMAQVNISKIPEVTFNIGNLFDEDSTAEAITKTNIKTMVDLSNI